MTENETQPVTLAMARVDAVPPQRVRVHTVVWGFLLIGVATIFFATAQFDLARFNPAIVTVWAVLGTGVLAMLGGLAGALFRRT